MVDLHTHSDLSASGVLSMTELLTKAEKDGIKIISITDHNTALPSLLLDNMDVSKFFSGKIIPGIEIDACYKGLTFEVMAYGFNPYKVQEWAYSKFGNVEFRQKLIMKKLIELCRAKGFRIDEAYEWNSATEFAHHNIYHNLMQYPENEEKFNYTITDEEDFYRNTTSNPDFILYLDMSFLWPKIKEVVDVIHSAHGKVFLARPCAYRQDINVATLLKIARKNKVDGVEVFIPVHTKEHIEKLLSYCKKYKLLVSGGSMFTGETGRNKFSMIDVSNEYLRHTLDVMDKTCYKKPVKNAKA
ncbi:MAG: PHP domain-containing protein [Clostridia bacterium]|nr:PHP domain-containing protein [Clostridia bacterium]